MTDFQAFKTGRAVADWSPTLGFNRGGHRAWKSSLPLLEVSDPREENVRLAIDKFK